MLSDTDLGKNDCTLDKKSKAVNELQSLSLARQPDAGLANPLKPAEPALAFPDEDVETVIPERFETIVRRFSDRVAVKTAERSVSYAELNAQANRIARALPDATGNKSAAVALALANGIPLLAAMLGVLKAGKHFVLVDPADPIDRIRSIIQDSQAESIIVDHNDSMIDDIASAGYRVIRYADIGDKLDSDNLSRAVAPGSLAMIVYTSGSTGAPKGVVWNHVGLLHRKMTRARESEVSERDRIALLSSHAGNTINDILLALLSGATLLPFDVRAQGAVRLGSWLATERLTICAIAAPLFRKMCESFKGTEKFSNLRILRLRSDTVQTDDVSLFKKYFPSHCALITGLASSEAGQLTTYRVDCVAELTGNEMPVGCPVADKEVLLLDDDGREVDFGNVGEIVVRSRYMALGYWRRPELTQAKFKVDPQNPATRIYFTGDLGMMRPDGCLIHKGRKDFRVKIRGYGVELGEVERAMQSHPAVSQAIAVGRPDGAGEHHLVVYYTTRETRRPTVGEFREFIGAKLPGYMTPSAFVRVDAIPLTANGKIDRRALPDPGSCRPELDTPYLAPRNEVEKTVARIFSECTGIDGVGIDDNFFDLGGDSLLLARLVSRLSLLFQREFSVAELFENASIAGIARLLEGAYPFGQASELVLSIAATDSPALSFAQQRLWFLDQLNPGDSAYNLLSVFEITGPLDVAALERSFNQIIARHEVLRTVFHAADGRACLRVLPSALLALPVVALGDGRMDDDAALQRQCAALARQTFDLGRAPLLRVSLLRTGDDQHILLLAVHHIVFDGWSMGVLWRELASCYEAFASGTRLALELPAVQYADFARWQRERMQALPLQEQLQYWRRQLDGITPLKLRADRPRPLMPTSRGAKRAIVLSADLSARLKRLSGEHAATLFMTLLAAFQVLLHRYTAQDDIAIGCPIAGRNRPEFENLIGFFLNILVLRIDTAGAPSFLELLERVRHACLDAYGRQDLPFEKLVEELHPERHLNRNPLVDVTFAFQNTPRVAPELCGASVRQLDIDSGIARFDLQLFLEESAGQLRGCFTYNTDLFDAQTIDRMAENFTNLLEGIGADPTQPIDRLPLLSGHERHKLLVEWNPTQGEKFSRKQVHQLFEDQAGSRPDALAVVFEDRHLSYRELNRKANQLAHRLRERGVRPETLVAVCMERSLEVVIALLAILKAGGGYVPIDPGSPPDRLKLMLEDTQPALVLTQEKFSSSLAEFADRSVCVDGAWDDPSLQSQNDPGNQAGDHSVAYVIYTSGSTGVPKGVVNVHGGLRNRLQWMQKTYRLTPADRVLQKTPLTFDVSVWELLWPLISGACLVMARPGGHRDSAYLVELINSRQITTMHFVPSMLALFLREAGVENCPTLRQVFCSGEALSYETQQRFFERTGAALYNLYGPTEASIDVTAWECGRVGDRPTVPIGRPIANTQIYLLDPHLEPVPIGVAGELHIGGGGLARGYLNHRELTKEKFIANPFSADTKSFLYKTGDLARYLPDGNIEFLGRMDNQVKIRGYRIELGEIETVLNQCPGVQSSVVTAREDAPGDQRLVGYVVAPAKGSFDAADARKHLKQKLPEYMIPSAFVLLDELPLTRSGKVDGKALPAPDPNRSNREHGYQAPRTPTEETLVAIWGEVLKLAKVGIHDNFFDLGGHSLLATQTISRIRRDFSVELPLRRLFESPTAAEMAVIITERQAKQPNGAALAEVLREVEATTEEEASEIIHSGS